MLLCSSRLLPTCSLRLTAARRGVTRGAQPACRSHSRSHSRGHSRSHGPGHSRSVRLSHLRRGRSSLPLHLSSLAPHTKSMLLHRSSSGEHSRWVWHPNHLPSQRLTTLPTRSSGSHPCPHQNSSAHLRLRCSSSRRRPRSMVTLSRERSSHSQRRGCPVLRLRPR